MSAGIFESEPISFFLGRVYHVDNNDVLANFSLLCDKLAGRSGQDCRRKGAQGGNRLSCPLVRGARGQECPFNDTIYFFNNDKYDGMKIMNLTFKSNNHCSLHLSYQIIPKCLRKNIFYISLNILDNILSQSKGCGPKIFSGRTLRPPNLGFTSLAFSLKCPCVSLRPPWPTIAPASLVLVR